MALLGLPSSSSAFSASLVFAKLPPATAESIPAPSPSRLSFQGLGQSRLPNFSSLLSACRSKSINFLLSGALAFGLALAGVEDAEAAKTGVNKPELLPKEFTPVIDVAGFLSDGQERRIAEEIASIERDTGFKLRILAQNYPDTPGLAIKDFWNVDDRTIVFVADPTFGNVIHFNVGATVDLDIPKNFWSRVAGKYGNVFYWKEKVFQLCLGLDQLPALFLWKGVGKNGRRYFSNVAVRDEHFKTKRHKKRVKQMMGPTPHTQVDADLAAGMGMPDNGPKLMLM
ncbi:hypothetical protein SAY87_026769 [Trapa incisa]|uniref:Thylakoid lumenal 15.0 kDa protein 2, chloroplastic n=1 Tax=Trapa incisa TaxID=236973 RepID=A0AAN7JM44_9MYRT|nr:hypothetical protein SAY87_026769 [Trapa incisa]